MNSSGSSRRMFLRSLSLAPAALVVAGASRAMAQSAVTPVDGACTVNTDDGLPGSLHFVEVSANPDQLCRGCTFWTAQSDAGTCGDCVMLRRGTPPTGHCDSWAARG